MELVKKFGKVFLAGVIILVILLVILLFFTQREGDAEKQRIEELAEEAVAKQYIKNIEALYEEMIEGRPYFEDHPEELEITEVGIIGFSFIEGFDEQGNPIFNIDRTFEKGKPVRFNFDVIDYMDPKYEEDYYVYYVQIETETTDSEGNLVPSLSEQVADMASHNIEKDQALSFNIELVPDESVAQGTYTMKIIVKDMISELNTTMEEEFSIE